MNNFVNTIISDMPKYAGTYSAIAQKLARKGLRDIASYIDENGDEIFIVRRPMEKTALNRSTYNRVSKAASRLLGMKYYPVATRDAAKRVAQVTLEQLRAMEHMR